MRKAPKLFKQNVVKMRKESRGLDDLQAWQNKKTINYN